MGDIDQSIPVENGQDVEQAAPEIVGQGEDILDTPVQENVSFYEGALPNGEKLSFKTKEELDKALKDSYFMRSDYTKKTQTLSQQAKALEKERKDFEEQMKSFNSQKEYYDKIKSALDLRPDIGMKLRQLAQQPAGPDALYERSKQYVDQNANSIKKELEDLKKWKESQEMEGRKRSAVEKLKEKYGDFDEKAVFDDLDAISSGDLTEILERLHLAIKGRSLTPAQVEQKLIEKMKRKQGADLGSPGSPSSADKQYKSFEEARNEAMKEYANLA